MSVLSVYRIGMPAMLSTPWGDMTVMLAAGAFNLVAYLGLAKGLQLTTIIHANVLNASQVAMCAVAGMLLFSESPNLAVLLGVGLTVVGTMLIDRPRAEEVGLAPE